MVFETVRRCRPAVFSAFRYADYGVKKKQLHGKMKASAECLIQQKEEKADERFSRRHSSLVDFEQGLILAD